MSHYTVAVFTDENTSVEDLLDPFDENLEVDEYIDKDKEELIFDGKSEIRYFQKVFKKYMKDKKAFRRDHKKNIKYLSFVMKIPLMKKSNKEKIFKFASRLYDPNKIDENGNVWSTYNQDSKWDWYEIGGRWKNMLILKDGTKTDSAKIKDIAWDLMKEENIKHIIPYEEFLEKSYYSKEYLKRKYPTENDYIKDMTSFTTYAVLKQDGEWIEPGSVGWWGTINATAEQEKEFTDNYEKNFLKDIDENLVLTIVDCHI